MRSYLFKFLSGGTKFWSGIMRYWAFFFAAYLISSLNCASAQDDPEILVNRYNVLIQRDKLNVLQKTAKELNTSEGQAVVSAACFVIGCDPISINASIAEGARMIVPEGQQDMNGIIQTPVGYTICYAEPSNQNMGAGDKGIETHGDTTFNTTILRVVPGVNNLDGLGWYMVVPFKARTDTRVNAAFDVVWVKAAPGWQQLYPQCEKRGEHPWLARNNSTSLRVPCTLANDVCE